MAATWIVSANSSRARIFSQANAAAPLEEVNDMVNEIVREPVLGTSETDKLGPTSGTKSMHNVGAATPNKLYQPPQTPTQHQQELFARDVVGLLQQAHNDGRFQQLVLVVSPQFLGVLRPLLEPKLGSLVKSELNKDYTHLSADQLREQIQAHQK